MTLEAERAGNNAKAQQDIDNLTAQINQGNMNPGIGSRSLGFGGIHEARGRNGGRVYFRNTENGVEILGKSDKGNQEIVIKELRRLYE